MKRKALVLCLAAAMILGGSCPAFSAEFTDGLNLTADEGESVPEASATPVENPSQSQTEEATDHENPIAPIAQDITADFGSGSDETVILNEDEGGKLASSQGESVPIDEEHFPDENFRKYILEESGFDVNKNGVLENDEIASVTEINVSKHDIWDLTGINVFYDATNIDCSNNDLTSLDLSNASALTKLDCSGNELISLDLSNVSALTELDCSNNDLTSLDLSNVSALTVLVCYNNQLTSLDLSNVLALTELSCGGNQLTSLDLSNASALTVLSCGGNQLTSLDLSNTSALTELNCSDNELISLDLSHVSALTKLYCGFNKLTSLDLGNTSALTELGCLYNELTSLDLGNASSLTNLNCYNNQLTSLNLSNAFALDWLNCSNNELISLDLSDASALWQLYCDENKLTSLVLNNTSALSWLSCTDNQLTSLDLGDASVGDLFCGGNQLTSLDLGNASSLFWLSCCDNQLTSLDLSNAVSLGILDCADNLLTSLDISNNPALEEVDCSHNYIEDISMVTGWKEKDRFIFEPQNTPSTPTPYPTVEPTVEPTVPPTIAPTTTPEPTIDPTTTPEPTIDPTTTPEPTIVPTITPEPTIDPTATPEPTIVPTTTPEPTIDPTATPEPTIVPTAAPEPTIVPTATPIPTITPAATPEPTATPTVTPAQTPTITPSPSIVPDETFSAEPELGTRRVDLSWKKVDDADGYIIFIKEESTGKFKRLKTIWGADVISFSKLLDFGGTHTFKIQSFKQDKETHTSQYTDLGDEITLTLSQYSKYEQPTTKASTKTGSRQINLQWSKVEGADGYLLYMYNKETKKYDLLETLTGTDSTSFSFVNGLKNGETYSFRVRSYAVDKDGETQVKGKISAAFKTTTPPAKAQKPKAVSTTANQAKLTWTEMSTADGYSIYRCTSRNGKYIRVKTITDKDTITFTDKNLNSGITYYYKMRAFSLNPDGTRSYGKASAVKAVKIK